MKCKYLYFYIAQQKVPSSLWCYLISEELARTYNFFHQNENCEEPSLASRLIRSNKGNQTLPVTISKGSVESLENTQKEGGGREGGLAETKSEKFCEKFENKTEDRSVAVDEKTVRLFQFGKIVRIVPRNHACQLTTS